MSLNATTLSWAISATQTRIVLASGTGAAVGKFVKVDDEYMRIQDITNSPEVLVQRGQNGSLAVAHATLAVAAIGLGSDFYPVDSYTDPVLPHVYTYGASGAIEVAHGTHILKGPAGSVTMTLATPLGSQNGFQLVITAATAEAYTVTTPLGFNAGGGGADVGTYSAIGDSLTLEAVNGVWNILANEGVSLS